ncbi:hypothetical protein CAPTEDRAFT_190810 [Capitella teleta]|uniref:Uncharacterized protein n=1 Tax=Capitella teleta TaxID=283909 RepID=R7TIL8_CAPTE|nr:hypothetical protein CAPTEDRAFT_190810 [Capitella teleta]|eukprot:ELT90930.1 hypothetical protein CAPTEDRAFT_190810 [Capitella teleta]
MMTVTGTLIDFEQTNGEVRFPNFAIEQEEEEEKEEEKSEDRIIDYGAEYDDTVQLLAKAVRGGDLLTLKNTLSGLPEVERTPLLRARLKDEIPSLNRCSRGALHNLPNMMTVTGTLIDFEQTNGEVRFPNFAIEQEEEEEKEEEKSEDRIIDYGAEYDDTVQLLAKAVRGGDLLTLKNTLSGLPEVERTPLLRARLKGDTVALQYPPGRCPRGRMPYIDRDIFIREPTLLILGVSKLNPEVVAFLASFEAFIQVDCSLTQSSAVGLEKNRYKSHVFTEITPEEFCWISVLNRFSSVMLQCKNTLFLTHTDLERAPLERSATQASILIGILRGDLIMRLLGPH